MQVKYSSRLLTGGRQRYPSDNIKKHKCIFCSRHRQENKMEKIYFDLYYEKILVDNLFRWKCLDCEIKFD